MVKVLLKIYDRLSKNKALAILLFVALVALCVISSLRLHFQENIADFLPTDKEKEKYTSVYNDLGNQGQVTLIFSANTDSIDADETTYILSDALDAFEEKWLETDTAGLVSDLRCHVDDTPVFDAIDLMWNNPPLFLTENDYRRADSLLAEPDYIATCMGNIKRMLSFPTSGMVVEGVRHDPLNLYSPALQRLNALNAMEGYQVENECLFNENGDKAFAFLTSPFDGNDTKQNAILVKMIDKVIALTEAEIPEVSISAVGAPTIAVTNAQQIKRDSFLSIILAVVLIFSILMFTMSRKRNLLWLGISILFGWIFALAVIALFKSGISIIVVGIGSVIVGIAVNYPLHYLDHIKQQPDKRAALKEVIQPLVIGNITTVAAFACLVFVKAEAMRDLGLFGALMLIGTILFVMVFLPVFAASPKKTNRLFDSEIGTQSEKWKQIKRIAFLPIVLITIVLACFSKGTSFDSDLHNINYMTEQQCADLALLSQSLQNDESEDLIYLISEGTDFQSALETNENVLQQFRASFHDSVQVNISGMDGLLPSLKRQCQSIEMWNGFWARHADVADAIEKASREVGFAEGAFSDFISGIEKEYQPLEAADMESLSGLCSNYNLQHDSLTRIVNFVKVPTSVSENLKAEMRNGLPENAFVFDISDVGNNLVSALSDDFDYILYLCGFVVFFFLLVSFGNLELSLLSFLPLTVGWLWILGIMNIFDIRFNIVNIILATFIFGQGDDYTIFITEGLVYEYAYGKKMLKNYRNSVILSGILMFIGIGSLIFAKHPAMRSLAEVAIIGMATVVFMACYLPPIIFEWITMKKNQFRQVPITLKRLLYTFVSLLVFFIASFVIVTPLTLVYRLVMPNFEKKKLWYHQMICAFTGFAVKHIPGVKFELLNKVNENFEKPAVIIANHQSHLDLVCTLMLNPKLVILTNDWVWRNPIYGIIIRYAEFYPVSDGYDKNAERLKSLVERGYSIVVFPEGTRSEDGNILRFHKGAFQLAQALNVDLLPVFIHGAGDVMPKKDILFREGKITVKICQRIENETFAEKDTRVLTSECHKMFVSHYDELRDKCENISYCLPFVRYKYLYKGREVEQESRRMLRKIKQHKEKIENLKFNSISILNSGQGELAWVFALANRKKQVYAFENDEDKYLIALHFVDIPENLHFLKQKNEDVFTDLIIDKNDWLK